MSTSVRCSLELVLSFSGRHVDAPYLRLCSPRLRVEDLVELQLSDKQCEHVLLLDGISWNLFDLIGQH